MKLRNLEYRSLWYKKIYYYLDAGQSLSGAASTAANDIDTNYISFELQEGIDLSIICARNEFKTCFSSAEISLIAIAERTGCMKEICLSLSNLLKSQYLQKQKLVAASVYPGLVLLMAGGLLIMILTVIVPKINPLFSAMKQLPVATRILITLSNHVISFWYVDVIVLIGLFLLHKFVKDYVVYDKYIKRLQVWIFQELLYVKDMYTLWYIERWMHVMYLSLSSNVALAEALFYAAQSIDNVNIRGYFLKMRTTVLEGYTCSASMNSLPPFLHKRLKDWISIISSGERTGSLVDVFQVSHTHIRENLIESIDRFQKIIEPILIICVGVMVLCICLSIILPMYQLTQSLQ